MVKIVEPKIQLLQPHALPEGCPLHRLQRAVERAREESGEANRQVHILSDELSQLQAWLDNADANSDALEFATRQARAILVERSLKSASRVASRAMDDLNAAGTRFQNSYREYERLLEELRTLESSERETEEPSHAGPPLSSSIRRRQAAARARRGDEDDPRAAEIERIRARISELVES